MPTQREWLTQHIANQYGTEPEYLWTKHPDYAVYRHSSNRKWFAIIMRVSGSQISLSDVDELDIINVKLPPEWITQLSGQHGFAPAYHMNKKHWLSVRLDNTLPENQILDLLKTSFAQTQ
ncbi:MmcQ/YjbR family DNA-binding protein [Kingella negevensis]|uniref:MmcQ/YjbR family DNA-binding protein n=1 Tax=Kingella negevensis TaxID=1522312 RepID=UPI00050A1DC7|nr:MmcQ/YjbR family DNA-binding protein [Kingella negevensis]MDK4689163.1 MmcQ/YjbR family DNA-binding protein [Kingella negevensis]WII90742.1 MmcQ/YjbR family DNA-binding protein [Kingella negevensis]